MHSTIPTFVGYAKAPSNKGSLIGQKRPLDAEEPRAAGPASALATAVAPSEPFEYIRDILRTDLTRSRYT